MDGAQGGGNQDACVCVHVCVQHVHAWDGHAEAGRTWSGQLDSGRSLPLCFLHSAGLLCAMQIGGTKEPLAGALGCLGEGPQGPSSHIHLLHVTDEKIEAQSSEVTCYRSQVRTEAPGLQGCAAGSP